jgi:transaldolase
MKERVDRPNLALKIPATQEAFAAIEECTAEGLNVNATVIFARNTYEGVIQAYRRGLERRRAHGLPLDITSFASVFMSRYDAGVDEIVMQRIRESKNPNEIKTLKGLLGQVSIANAWVITRRFREFFEGPEFAQVRAAGGRVQRPLWAGVGARNSRYGDVMYMEALAIPGTAITASDLPVDGYRVHGVPLPAEDDGSADVILETFQSVGIDVDAIAHQMEASVVEAFTAAFVELVEGVEHKAEAMDVHAQLLA